MSDEDIIRKHFSNGDVVLQQDDRLVYRTDDADYTVVLDMPDHPGSATPYGVTLVRTSNNEQGSPREQRLPLAEYGSFLPAAKHAQQIEQTLSDQGRAGLEAEMMLVAAMPYESFVPLGKVDDAPVLPDDTATAEAPTQSLAPTTPLFAEESVEDRPHEPERSVLPVTFDNDMTPLDAQGRYTPHHRDAADTVHFFAVVPRPDDSPLPQDVTHELRYFRVRRDGDDVMIHDSLPVMPVSDPHTSPWPLPALHLQLEDGDLDAAQTLARDTARNAGLPFPDTLPQLDTDGPPREPDPGWYHFDTALAVATPQGIDDGYSVGMVDVYANHENGQWAARYLPMGEFDTFDDALAYQQHALHQRALEDRDSALAPAGFNDDPAIYQRIALAEADAALTDLLEQNDGHLPDDYEGEHEPMWESLSSKEWNAYRDHLHMVTHTIPEAEPVRERLPTATPSFATDKLVAASKQPDAPLRQPEDFAAPLSTPTWQLAVVPAHDPDGAVLGYSAVCVVDFGDLTGVVSQNTPERAQWLEVAQFESEDRAKQFQGEFLAQVGSDGLGRIPGPALAVVVAEDQRMDSQWRTMDQQALKKLKNDEWSITTKGSTWNPRRDNLSPSRTIETADLDLDL